MFVTQEGAAAADVPACDGHDRRAADARRDGAGALGARPQADAALRLRLHRQRRHPEPVDSGHDRRRLRADADAAAVRQRPRQDQRPQRPVAPAGRHLRRRHRRSSARVGGVADRRARLRPHAAGRRSEAGDDGRSAHGRARSAGRRGFRRSSCRSISRRRAPAIRATASTSTPCRGGTRRRRTPPSRIRAIVFERLFGDGGSAEARQARMRSRGQHPRLGPRRSEPRGQQPRPRRQGQAGRVSRLGARGRAAHPELRVAAARHRAAGAAARTFRPRSTRTPS